MRNFQRANRAALMECSDDEDKSRMKREMKGDFLLGLSLFIEEINERNQINGDLSMTICAPDGILASKSFSRERTRKTLLLTIIICSTQLSGDPRWQISVRTRNFSTGSRRFSQFDCLSVDQRITDDKQNSTKKTQREVHRSMNLTKWHESTCFFYWKSPPSSTICFFLRKSFVEAISSSRQNEQISTRRRWTSSTGFLLIYRSASSDEENIINRDVFNVWEQSFWWRKTPRKKPMNFSRFYF